MRYEFLSPTKRQLRSAIISGAIAESITVPVIVTLGFVHHDPVRWGYVVGAVACVAVGVAYLAVLFGVRHRQLGLAAHASAGFVVICSALASQALVELAAGSPVGFYRPVPIVAVVYMCLIGDRWMRVGVSVLASAVIAVTSWLEGIRGAGLVTVIVVYSSAIAVIAWILSRTVHSLAGVADSRQSMHDLSEAIGNADTLEEGLQVGLPMVTRLLPCDRVTAYVRDLDGRVEAIGAWPDPGASGPSAADRSASSAALVSGRVVTHDDHVGIPIGYCERGELVLVVHRSPAPSRTGLPAGEAAEFLATSFLRMTSRVAFVASLRRESRTDALTGLANRRGLVERLGAEMARSARSGGCLGVAMIDLDLFKSFNDRFGHLAGDTVLRTIAALMVSKVRTQDLVARYGGEEFCLVLPDTDLTGATRLLEVIRSGSARTGTGVTLSVGITVWDGFEDVPSLLGRADRALYRAKTSGRNRVVSVAALSEV